MFEKKRTITELMAGKHQGNVFASLMTNFDTAREALDASLGSSGSAMREHAKWSESLEARLNKLKSTWQSLSQTFMDSDFLKSLLDGVIGLINGLDKLIDKVGVLPTFVGLFMGGKTLFNNSGIFKTMNADLDGFTNKVGIANKSFAELIQTYKAGITGKGVKGMLDGFSYVKGSLGGLTKRDISNIQAYNDQIDQCVTSQTAFNRTMLTSSTAAKNLVAGANGGKVAIQGLTTATNASRLATIGATAAATALNAALTMGISLIISGVISAITKWINAEEELAEKVDEVTSKFQEQHTELVRNKSSFESQAARYSQLAKGVDEFGNNISLTTDEYAEYQDIVNSIADQIPTLVKGYDAQGNAILDYTGNVKTLTAAYEELIKKQNESILKDNYKNIVKDFKNEMKAFNGESSGLKNEISVDSMNKLEEALDGKYSKDKIKEVFGEAAHITDVVDALQKEGLAKNVHWYSGYDTYWDAIADAIKHNPDKVQKVINNFKSNVDDAVDIEGMKSAAQAALSKAFDFSDSAYKDINNKTQALVRQIVGNFDAEQFKGIVDSGKTVEEYINNMLNSFKNMSKGETTQLEAAFDLQTKFNGGDISYGEYIQGIKNAEKLIDGLNIDDEVKNQIKLTLDTEEIQNEYDALKTRLTSKEYGIKMEIEEAEEFLDGLTSSEYQVAVDLIASGEVDLNKFNIDSLRDYIEKEAKLLDALNYTISIDVETENIEALNTAMAESVSGAGLSSEAIAALKSRYAELEGEGYNLSAMFEETANGIHLNREAVSELEQKLASDKLAETDKQLDVLKNRYDELATEIDNCTDASKRASLYTEQQSIVDKINDLATLAAQYEGLTSAYNAWMAAEEAGSERDMYEGIIEGFETVGDEISRGWVDDGTIKFLELLTGKTGLAGKSGKELKKIYDDLDDTIKNTTYSIRDFFTVDEDGNSTNAGVYNFLDAVGQLEEEKFGGKDIVKRDKDGNIISFDFELAAKKDKNGKVIKNGDQVIAEALGISEELVQIMVRASDDAGFVVDLEGAYTQLADLKTEAEAARDTLISLQKNGLKELKGVDVKFNFDAEGQDLVEEQGKAVELLNKFKDKNGKIDLKMEGAQQALDIAEYLTIKLDDLTEPKIMQIDVSEVDEDLRNPIEKMQEIVKLSKKKNLVSLTGDKKEIKETQDKINKVAKQLEELNPEIKAKVGIDENWDAKTIASKVEKGEIEIPAELELDVQMSDDLKDMRLMMMKLLGLASDNEVKLKVGFDIDESLVDTLTEDQKEVVVKYLAEHKEVDEYTPEQKEALVKYIADGGNLDNYTPEEKQAIVQYLADGGNVESYTPEEKQAIVEYLTDSGDPDSWTPEQKEAVAKFKKDSAEVDNYTPEDKKAIAKFIKDSDEPDNYQPPNKTQNVKADLDSSEPDNYQPKDKKFTVKAVLQKIGDWTNKLLSGGSKKKVVNGTANVNGTAFAGGTTGRAFKHGDWSTKDSGTALVGELGTETLVRNGRYYTIGDTGAEFIHYEKGDIIFNHKQTEELFKNGKVTSGGGRGKALVEGTAFSSGSGGIGKVDDKTVSKKKSSSSKSSSSSKKSSSKSKSKSSSKKSSSSKADDFKETIDWIEIAISRIERTIDNLDQKANNVYKTWSSRNKALTSEISKVGDEIELQQDAYNRYMQEANNVGLSSSWAKKVREGKVDIQTIKDEALAEKIKDYETWYNKALACKDAIEELKETEAKLYAQRFENIQAQYDGILQGYEHTEAMLNEYISQAEEQGHIVSKKYYQALINNEKQNISQLKKEQDDLIKARDEAVNSGKIAENSEEWYKMCAEIDSVTQSIEESTTALLEFDNAIREIDWSVFDLIQERISGVASESEFLIELMSNDKLFDDNGKLTGQGVSTMGLHALNYNAAMYQSDEYGKEIAKLNSQIAEDPYDQELINRRNELIELQRESILEAENQKNAIKDLVEEGINLELDALEEKINLYQESLDSQKD